MLKKCAILLATYNGEKYLKEQLESLLSQRNVMIDIYISDDGSYDNTLRIIKLYKQNNIFLLPSTKRMGSASQNFFRLIRDVDFSSYNYIAFADQDDIWYENKLSKAIEAIVEKDLGGYSSNVIAFWHDGKKKLVEKSFPQQKYDFLFGSPGPGCTQVFSREFMQSFKNILLKKEELSKKIDLHDWVIYAYARANGYNWWIDSKPSMDYRQHENNEFGVNSGLKAFVSRWKKARNGWYSKQILTTAEFCNFLDAEPIKYLRSNSYIDKFRLASMIFKLRRRKSEALMLGLIFFIPGFK